MSKSIRIIQNLLEEYDVPVNVVNKLYNMINKGVRGGSGAEESLRRKGKSGAWTGT
jgi:hypothetical protein